MPGFAAVMDRVQAMKMPDLSLSEGLDGLGMGSGFVWDGAAWRDVPALLRTPVEAGTFTTSTAGDAAIEQRFLDKRIVLDLPETDAAVVPLIGLILSRLQAAVEADGLLWGPDGPAANAMWITISGGTIFVQCDLDGDSRPDRIFSFDTRGMTFRTVLDQPAAAEKPAVSSISFAANDGTLALGEAVAVAVEFSVPVTVTGGVLALSLSNGGVAYYVSGAGSDRLLFSYIPGAGEDTADLSIAGLIENGGRITGAGGVLADMSGLAVNPPGILAVDTAALARGVALIADSGASGDRITSDGGLAVTGAEAGAIIEYSADGGASWSPSFLPVEGANTVLVRQTDLAGNISAATSFSFMLDAVAPDPPAATLASDSGIDADRISNSGTLVIDGAETGASVQYSADGGASWSPGFLAVEGPNTVMIRQVDVAGNFSAASSFSFTVDTQTEAPSVALVADSGVAGDGITSDGTLRVTGTEAAAEVQYSVDGIDWSPSFTAAEGRNSVLVRQVDLAGNVSSATSFTFTLDTAAEAPSITLAADSGTPDDRVTNAGALAVSGAEAGAEVLYSTDGGASWSASFAAQQGSNTVQVRQIDAAGNVSGATNFVFVLDTEAPSAPQLHLAADSGTAGDRIVNTAMLNVAGAEAGATLQYSMDGGLAWSPVFTPAEGLNMVLVRQLDVAGNASVAASFSFTLDTAAAAPAVSLAFDTGAPGDRITNNGALAVTGAETGALLEYSIDGGSSWSSSFSAAEGPNAVLVRQTDMAGNVSAAASFSFVLNTLSPPALLAALASDTGIAGDQVTSNASLSLSGVEAGAVLQYSTDDGLTWSGSFTPAEGFNGILVRQVGVTGNPSDPASLSFTLDTGAPAAPSVALAADTGIAGDRLTNSGALNAGGIETGAAVQYSSDGGASWSASFGPREGLNIVLVRQMDAASNASASASFSFTLDTSPPPLPSVVLASDSGVPADLVTNHGVLSVSGIESGAGVQYSIDGGVTWTASFVAVEGLNGVLARQVDQAGNPSSAVSLSFTLDTAPPAAPVAALASDTGADGDRITSNPSVTVAGTEPGATLQYSTDGGASWSSGFTPADGLNAVLVRQVDQAGNASSAASLGFTLDTAPPAGVAVALVNDTGIPGDGITKSAALSVTGTETGATLQYSADSGAGWSAVFIPVEGQNNVLVRQLDVAGNASAAAAISFALDTVAAPPYVALAADSGVPADQITNDGQLIVAGIEAGTTVQYSTDGGMNWATSFIPVDGANAVLVRQVDLAGNASPAASFSFTLDTGAPPPPPVALVSDTGTPGDGVTSNGALNAPGVEAGATLQYSRDGGASWSGSFTPSEGLNTVLVRQIDVAGNASPATSLSFKLDTTAPSAPTAALASDSGAPGDGITNNGALAIAGTEAGAGVQYSRDGGASWSDSFAATEGDNSVLVRQLDLAGNASSAASLSFILDPGVPAAPLVTLAGDSGSVGDNLTNTATLDVSGLMAGATVQYSANGGVTWSLDFTPLEGANTLLIRQLSLSGNISAATGFSFTLDTAPPSAPAVSLALDSGIDGDKITSAGVLNISGTEAGAIIQYSADDGTSWSSSFTPAEGANEVLVRQVDMAGNASVLSSFSFTLDTVSPSAPSASLADDSGVAGDGISNSGTLAITGIGTGAAVQYSTDGGTSWTSSFTPLEGSNAVLIRQTDVAGNTSGAAAFAFRLDTSAAAPAVALATDSGIPGDKITNYGGLIVTGTEVGAAIQYSANGSVSWVSSFTPTEGPNTVLVRQVDVAGNTSTATSFSFTLDSGSSAPWVSLITDSGIGGDLITNTPALDVGGIKAGAAVQYSVDGGATWTESLTPAEGVNTLLVRQVDAAGNVSAATSFSFTLDTAATAPGAALTTDSGTGAMALPAMAR